MPDKNIREYIIVSDDSANLVTAAVNRKIGEGWQPFGQLEVSGRGEYGIVFAQPMVKYGSPPVNRPSPDVLLRRD